MQSAVHCSVVQCSAACTEKIGRDQKSLDHAKKEEEKRLLANNGKDGSSVRESVGGHCVCRECCCCWG